MDSLPISSSDPLAKLRFLIPLGEETAAPEEWSLAWVEIAVPTEEWRDVKLWRVGHQGHLALERLPVHLREIGGKARIVAEWTRAGAGRYRLHLDHGNHQEERTFTIQPRKISPEAYALLLEDLETRLPATIAIGLQRLGALTGLRLMPPTETTLAAELLRLQHAMQGRAGRPGLVRVLEALATAPHYVLTAEEHWVPPDRARRIKPSRLAAAFVSGSNMGATVIPLRVPDLRVQHTANVYENQLVRLFHDQVAARLRRLARALEAGGYREQSEQARQMTATLRRSRKVAVFLDEVGDLPHAPTRLTMVLLRKPPYRAALEGLLELHRRAVARLDEPALEAPLENLPYLYEIWCALIVISEVIEEASRREYQILQQSLATPEHGGVYVRLLRHGRQVLALKSPDESTTVRLIPQLSYGRKSNPLRSISFTQVPDLTLEVRRNGRSDSLYLFDPKYKLKSEEVGEGEGRPKKIDIDAMHAYRDAIRDFSGQRVVRYAAILYPGPRRHFPPGIDALPAVPGREVSLRERLRDVIREALDGGSREHPTEGAR